MNRPALALLAFALGMLAMDVVWVHRLLPGLTSTPTIQQPSLPRRSHSALT